MVDVVRMRFKGAKVPRERLRAIPPVRGELAIFKRYDHWAQRHVPVAGCQPSGWAAHGGCAARTRLRTHLALSGPQCVLVGDEAGSVRKSGVVYRQAWWCRVVSVEAAADLTSRTSDGSAAGC